MTGSNRQFVESKISDVENIVCEIDIIAGVSAADVVFLVAAPFHEFLEFRQDVVVAAFSVNSTAQTVMDFLAPVQAQYDVVHFFIQEFIDFVVQQHAVRCESETESLPGLLFLTARIFDDLLHNAPSHQRLTAEEVDVQVTVESGILKQEIDCLLADFEFHDRPVAVVLALASRNSNRRSGYTCAPRSGTEPSRRFGGSSSRRKGFGTCLSVQQFSVGPLNSSSIRQRITDFLFVDFRVVRILF